MASRAAQVLVFFVVWGASLIFGNLLLAAIFGSFGEVGSRNPIPPSLGILATSLQYALLVGVPVIYLVRWGRRHN